MSQPHAAGIDKGETLRDAGLRDACRQPKKCTIEFQKPLGASRAVFSSKNPPERIGRTKFLEGLNYSWPFFSLMAACVAWKKRRNQPLDCRNLSSLAYLQYYTIKMLIFQYVEQKKAPAQNEQEPLFTHII